MSSPKVLELDFPTYIREKQEVMRNLLSSTDDEIQESVVQDTPDWIASHAMYRKYDVIHLAGTAGHENWNEDVLSAVTKRLAEVRNRAGKVVILTTD